MLLYLASPIDIIPGLHSRCWGSSMICSCLAAGLGLVLWLTPGYVIEDHLGALE